MPKVLICAATGTEAQACQTGIHRSSKTNHFEILKTGIGSALATQSLQGRLSAGLKPRLIISSGFAGGWSPDLAVGTWIGARAVFNEQGVSIENLKRFPSCLETVIISVPEIFEAPPARLTGFLTPHGLPIAVDMETFALAKVAREHEIPLAVIRYISDSPKRPLPAFVRHFTELAVSNSPRSKAQALIRGGASLASNPARIASFLREGARWRSEMIDGWEKFANELFSELEPS